MKIQKLHSLLGTALIIGLGGVAGQLRAAPHFTEYPIPTANSSPKGVTRGLDGAIWFCESPSGSNRIGRSTPAGIITELSLPLGSSCSEIIGVPGGVYFTEPTATKIGFMSYRGMLTEYPIPTAAAIALTRTSNGDIWFVEGGSARPVKVGKLSGGVVTEYSPFGGDDTPRGIAVGSDGNLWITDIQASEVLYGYIEKLTPAGTLAASYNLGENHVPFDIIPGPDGALWFTDNAYAGASVGRITTTGVVTQYLLPPLGVSLGGEMTVGPGGIWFTEPGLSKTGRITPTGLITEFPTPTSGAFPYGITRGPDGAIWFTEQAANILGRYGP